MKRFLSEDFLLSGDAARRLYFDFAATQPIYDYHSHLVPAEIAENRRFENIASIWLDGDHYKWRAMRTAGVDERLITGNAGDHEKFLAFAAVVPQCIGNPIYHWTHMELKRPFGITDVLLSADTADVIWQATKERLADDAFSARGLLEQFDVRMLGTTDDPVDSLGHHAAIAEDTDFHIDVLPTWRPDLLFKPERDEFKGWIEALGAAADLEIRDFSGLLDALGRRLDHFSAHGCVSADHGFDRMPFTAPGGSGQSLFAGILAGERLDEADTVAWRSELAVWLGHEYARRGWVMQLHIGAQRDNNTRGFDHLGPNTGFDSIGDDSYAAPLARFLDTLDREHSLPKTVLYCLNPRDNEMLATMAGNFQGDGIPGKIQFGSAWWFNDQKDGMWRQLTSVAQMSLLSRFIGMLTDSRSLLSFSRHEYFRRVLCDLVGGWIESGEAPADFDLIGGMIADICAGNTRRYFGLDSEDAPVPR